MEMETTKGGGDGKPQQAPPSRHHRHHHFVLVHGLCHGAWCWYKVATALRRAGHSVTAPDMAGCGAHPARLHEVSTFEEYSRPLLDAVAALLPPDRAVLVGHSHGGLSVALAAQRFPEKVAAAVFVTAALPAIGGSMFATTTEEFVEQEEPEYYLDTKQVAQENPDIPGNPIIFGPNFMAQRLYQHSPPEDLTLALSLLRPANQFSDDALMRDEQLLTEDGYGSARRVFVVVEDDRGIPAEFQRRMVAQSPGVEVEKMAVGGGADHMAMLSRPEELAELLVRAADKLSSESE
ncbi:hypothetical protein U9M48_043741 [Paspalum notatum var. saurae]|uniref:AB hydrolase-1 domain-containing protein n=1 Tax=Paspalum notatum var. saurae TaxID=547442 RepID=A0AAQ3XGS8_PASNO